MSHEIIDKNVLEARQAKMARSRQVQQDALAEAHRSRQEARSSEEARAVHDLLSALEADMAPTVRRRRRTTRAAASGTGGGSSSSGVGRGSPSFGVGGAPFLGWVAPAPSAGASMTSAPRPTAARAPGRRKTVQEHNAEVDRMAAAKGVDLRWRAPSTMLGQRPCPPQPDNMPFSQPVVPPVAPPEDGWVLEEVTARAPIVHWGRGEGLTPGTAPAPVGEEPFLLAMLEEQPVLDMPPLPVDTPAVTPVPVVAEGRAVPTAAAAAAIAAAIAAATGGSVAASMAG